MESIMFDYDDDKFLQQAVLFCNNVDEYIAILDLDMDEIESFKANVQIFLHVSSRYPSFTPSFIQHNVLDLRLQLASISKACVRSRYYNRAIGQELGFDTITTTRYYYTGTWRTWFSAMASHSPML